MIFSITRPSNASACVSFFKNSKNYENHFVKAVPLVVTVLLSLNFLQETKKTIRDNSKIEFVNKGSLYPPLHREQFHLSVKRPKAQ